MKVLILSQYFYPEVGATQSRMYEFARHLASQGADVTVVTEFPNHPHGRIPPRYRGKLFEQEFRDGFRILRVWVWTSPKKNFHTRLLFYNSYLVLSVIRSLGVGSPDVVLATSPPLFVGAAGYLVAKFKRAHFVLDVRDLWPAAAVALGELSNSRLIAWAEKFERFLYRRAGMVTTVTCGFRDYICARGTPPKKVHWIPNGTLPHHFKPAPSSPELRVESGMHDRFLLTFAGTQGIAQGLSSVLQTAELCRSDPTIGFIFIGAGPAHQELVVEKDRRNLGNVYFKDQVPMSDIISSLNASDALLVPLRNDPAFDTFVPSKLFDYMACEKPILLGVNGEAAEILQESGGGLHFEPENPQSLLAVIRKLQENPALCREMGKRGRRYVLQNFDRRKQAMQLEKLLVGLLRAV